MTSLHDFTMRTLDGQEKKLADFAGKTLLVVNVASQCGLTPQYQGLEELQRHYADRGFSVLGFPCNDFGAQEPGTEAEIKTFCETRYSVTFPLFAKVRVLGPDKAPLYTFLTAAPTQPDGPGDIAWNFAKFVIDPEGRVVARFSPTTAPLSEPIMETIERTLR